MPPSSPSPDRRFPPLAVLALAVALAVAGSSAAATTGANRAHHRLGGAHAVGHKSKGRAAKARSAPRPAKAEGAAAPTAPTAPTVVDPPSMLPAVNQPPAPPTPPLPAPAPDPGSEPDPAPGPAPAPNPDPVPTPDPSPPSHSLYWGAWIKGAGGEAPWRMAAATDFEQLLSKSLSLIHWSSPFKLSDCGGYCAFQAAQFDAVRGHGAIPFFSWNPGPGGGEFTDAAIAAGAQDAYVRAWAEAAKHWGHPFFLRFAWEMNGSWFPWGVGSGTTSAADYVAMWRHVHDVFASVGALNATWVWCPNIDPYGHRTPMASVYPGDEYVDWTCLDGYNGANPWKSFSDLFKSSYETIAGEIAPGKPMIVAETASTESGGAKSQWIADMLDDLPTEFPKIRGLMWFDKVEEGPGGRSDWPLESSASATAAFAAGIQGPAFAGSDYGDLAISPIPAP